MAEVKMYTVDYCPYCKKAKALLNQKGVEFEEIDISDQPEMRDKLAEMTGGAKTVPQIFINGKPIGGSSDLVQLDQSGELDKLLSA